MVAMVMFVGADTTLSSWSAVCTMVGRLCPRSPTHPTPSWSAASATPWCGTSGESRLCVGGRGGGEMDVSWELKVDT